MTEYEEQLLPKKDYVTEEEVQDIISSNLDSFSRGYTGSRNLTGAFQINGSLAPTVQVRAETFYQKSIFVGSATDGSTATTASGGSITRYLLETLIEANNASSTSQLKSLQVSSTVTNGGILDFTSDFEFIVNAKVQTYTGDGELFWGVGGNSFLAAGSTYSDLHIGWYYSGSILYITAYGGSGRTFSAVSVPNLTLTDFHTYRFTKRLNTTTAVVEVNFFIDDTLIGVLSTNIPNSSDAVYLAFLAERGSTGQTSSRIANNYTLIKL